MICDNTIVVIVEDNNSDARIIGIINNNEIRPTNDEDLEGIEVNNNNLANVVYEVATENNDLS